MVNPYLRIPIILPGNEPDPEKEVEARLQPDQVQSYHPCYHWGSLIYMLGGSCIMMTKLSCDELDRIFAHYWNQVEKRDQEAKNSISLLQ